MDPILHFILFLLAIAALVAGVWRIINGRRRDALMAVAARLGWDYEPDPGSFTPGASGFPLFSEGDSRQADHLILGTFGSHAVEAFDYRYTFGTFIGGDRVSYSQSVVHIEDAALALPTFWVRPQNLVLKLYNVSGDPKIDLPEYPEFSKRSILCGPDEAAIRARFVGAIPEFLAANPSVAIDGGGGHLFVFHPGLVVKPKDYEGWLKQAYELIRAFYTTVPPRVEQAPMPPVRSRF